MNTVAIVAICFMALLIFAPRPQDASGVTKRAAPEVILHIGPPPMIGFPPPMPERNPKR
jgi:hypothetical protein